jgi:2-polyprenyl-3-methyl-5-hydroxy-6-metoxy-1,4-benzoquinol methylase
MNTAMATVERPQDLAAMAKSLYRTGPALRRTMQHLRPYNCPLEVLISLAPESGLVFDIGCGCGIFLGLAVACGKKISGVGVDTSDASIEMAMAMRDGLDAAMRERLTFQRIRATADWPAGPFDMVSMIDVMHHIPPAQQAESFAAAARMVKPGGALLYKDMVRRPMWRAAMNRLHDLAVAREWIHYWPIAEVESAARESGLSLVRGETINRLWYGHELRVFRRGA